MKFRHFSLSTPPVTNKLRKTRDVRNESKDSHLMGIKERLRFNRSKGSNSKDTSATPAETSLASQPEETLPNKSVVSLKRVTVRALKALRIKSKPAQPASSGSNPSPSTNSPTAVGSISPQGSLLLSSEPTLQPELHTTSVRHDNEVQDQQPSLQASSSTRAWGITIQETCSIPPATTSTSQQTSDVNPAHEHDHDQPISYGDRPVSIEAEFPYIAAYVEAMEEDESAEEPIQSHEERPQGHSMAEDIVQSRRSTTQSDAPYLELNEALVNSAEVESASGLLSPWNEALQSFTSSEDDDTESDEQSIQTRSNESIPESTSEDQNEGVDNDTVQDLREELEDTGRQGAQNLAEYLQTLEQLFNARLGQVDQRVCLEIFQRRGFKGLLEWFENEEITRRNTLLEAYQTVEQYEIENTHLNTNLQVLEANFNDLQTDNTNLRASAQHWQDRYTEIRTAAIELMVPYNAMRDETQKLREEKDKLAQELAGRDNMISELRNILG